MPPGFCPLIRTTLSTQSIAENPGILTKAGKTFQKNQSADAPEPPDYHTAQAEPESFRLPCQTPPAHNDKEIKYYPPSSNTDHSHTAPEKQPALPDICRTAPQRTPYTAQKYNMPPQACLTSCPDFCNKYTFPSRKTPSSDRFPICHSNTSDPPKNSGSHQIKYSSQTGF